MKKRYIFANVENFLFYDVWDNGSVNENIFAYSNSAGDERAVVFYNNKYERAQGWIKQSCEYAVKVGEGENQHVEMRSKSLSEGLNLHAEDDKFVIFREHKSGLWFVRRSREICERGMFIGLNGFEYQVLMDIHEVADGADHKYQILCDTLQGRGCYDLDTEWQEICYRELYQTFSAYANAIIPDVHLMLNPATAEKQTAAKLKKQLKEVTDGAKAAALSFYQLANNYAGSGVKLSDPEKQFKTFVKILEKVILAKAESKAKKPENAVASLKKAKDGTTFLQTAFASNANTEDLLVCYALVKEYAENGLAERWAFARKLHEYFGAAGACKCDMRHELTKVFTLASVSDSTLIAKDEKKAAYEVIRLLTESNKAYILSGANRFNDVVWFNKEVCESSVITVIALALLAEKEEEDVLKMFSTLAKAMDAAEYKCAEFIKPFAPKEVKKSSAKKAAPKKSKNVE